MGYYVLGDLGQKYGPADLLTLNQWVIEGRVVSHTILEDESSGGKIVASSISDLRFPEASIPIGGAYVWAPDEPIVEVLPYSQAVVDTGVADHRLALILAMVSFILSILIPLGGLIAGGYGLFVAVRARKNGYKRAGWAILVNLAAVGFYAWTLVTGWGRGLFLRY